MRSRTLPLLLSAALNEGITGLKMLVRTLRAARPTQLLRCASAVPQTSPDATLKETLTAQIPQKQEELKQLKADHGSKVLGEVTVDQCIGGGPRPVWKSNFRRPTPSKRRLPCDCVCVDGVEVDATIQHERAVKF